MCSMMRRMLLEADIDRQDAAGTPLCITVDHDSLGRQDCDRSITGTVWSKKEFLFLKIS